MADVEALEDIVQAGEEIEAQENQEAALAAFGEGFSGEEKPEEKSEEKLEAESVEEDEKPDEKIEAEEKAEPEVKAEKKSEEDQALMRLRRLEGKVGELNSRILTMQNAGNRAAEEQGVKAPSKAVVDEAMESSEKWEALKKDFPEWVEAAEENWSIQEKRLKNLIPSDYISKDDLQTLFQAERESLKAELREEQELEKVDDKYPGWDNLMETDGFKAWLRVQDENTILLYDSDYASDYIKLLDLYHDWKDGARKAEETATQKQASQQRLEAAIQPTNRSSVARQKPESVEDAFAAGFGS